MIETKTPLTSAPAKLPKFRDAGHRWVVGHAGGCPLAPALAVSVESEDRAKVVIEYLGEMGARDIYVVDRGERWGSESHVRRLYRKRMEDGEKLEAWLAAEVSALRLTHAEEPEFII